MDKAPSTDTVQDEERRGGLRQRTLKGGRIIYGNFALSCECTIRNISESGARIRIDRSIGIPSEFHLLIPSELRMCKARISWQKGNEIGVKFLEPMRNPKLDPDLRISRLLL